MKFEAGLNSRPPITTSVSETTRSNSPYIDWNYIKNYIKTNYTEQYIVYITNSP